MDVVYLETNEVRCYEYNPRSLENPNINDIETSINANGLLSPFAVTQRPNERHYILYMGANSRLKIVQEKCRSGSPDEQARYKTIPCHIFPWKGEMDVMLKHGIENSARGDMAFIEEARYVVNLQAMLEKEEGKEFSARQFSKYLEKYGYTIGRNKISLSQFTCDYLESAIPEALETGLSMSNAAKLRKLWYKFEKLSNKYSIRSDKGTFQSVLKEHDDHNDCFRKHDLLTPLSSYIAEKTGKQLQNVLLELDLIKVDESRQNALRVINIPLPEGEGRPPDQSNEDKAAIPSEHIALDGYDSSNINVNDPVGVVGDGVASNLGSDAEQEKITEPEPEINVASSTPVNRNAITHLQTLRERAYRLALLLAKSSSNEAYVIPVAFNNGYIIEIPRYPAQLKEQERLIRVSAWWLLASISEQFTIIMAQIGELSASISETHVLNILSEPDINDRYERLQDLIELDIHHLYGPMFTDWVEKAQLTVLNDLVETCYQIKRAIHAE